MISAQQTRPVEVDVRAGAYEQQDNLEQRREVEYGRLGVRLENQNQRIHSPFCDVCVCVRVLEFDASVERFLDLACGLAGYVTSMACAMKLVH